MHQTVFQTDAVYVSHSNFPFYLYMCGVGGSGDGGVGASGLMHFLKFFTPPRGYVKNYYKNVPQKKNIIIHM